MRKLFIFCILIVSSPLIAATLPADSHPASRPVHTAPATKPATRMTAVASKPTTAPARVAGGPPNIILLYTGDQAPGMTGFEGSRVAKTPHLDRLAGESVRFTRCYVPTPAGAPCRATLLTGLYPHMHGVTSDGMTMSRYADTFTARLKKAGYACGLVGKWLLGGPPEGPLGYGLTDYAAINENPATVEGWLDQDVYVQGQKIRSGKFLTDWQGDRAIEFVEQFADRPFFLWVCFTAPHEPLGYPPGTETLFPPAGIELPQTMTANAMWPGKLQQSPAANRFRTMNSNPQSIREARSQCLAMISRIDDNVGRLLARLDELELRNNTVVVFTTAKGFALGDHGLFGKGPAFYDELVRVPLLMRIPQGVPASQVSSQPAAAATQPIRSPGLKIDRVVGAIDLPATFCELAGLPVPISMKGESLLPMIRNPKPGGADERFFEYHKQPGVKGQPDFEARVRGVVTAQYKFVDYLDENMDMVFDLKRDPEEMRNAINDSQYAPVIKVLRERVNRWRKDTKDPVPVQ